ncbi:TetR/AcrR family transcriptional regulator [Mitsuaria sp. WAJ17]|uniref:TetR/AcrR family transcriptional regulator n=1 Tax=Mitsuaria sp. WAJ17 TaxID=2761452 RepID=UPI00160374B9|nr:TetR/AcrR family transcriptional regulator [Mitsuaria sp. WAJ17]MBB2487519.1 TetR/AcrR family transcriptional regulator [Mitsuaria sp. WAJ17]
MPNSRSATTPAIVPEGSRLPGRPRSFDRAAALDLALDLFWRHGYEGVSTATLAGAMGIAPPSLYAAFGNKESLYRECLDLYAQRHGAFLGDALLSGLPARACMKQALRAACRQYTDPSHAAGCMVSAAGLQGAPANSAQHAQTEAMRLQARQAIEQRLRRARAEGELPAGADCAALAGYFALVIQGLAIQARDGASTSSLLRMVDVAMSAWPTEARAAARTR